jgi:hypothetical protein
MYGWASCNTKKHDTVQSTEDKREKIQALLLAKCYSMKLELLTNATVVDDAIRFVSNASKKKLKSSSDNSNEDDKEESKNLIMMKMKIS